MNEDKKPVRRKTQQERSAATARALIDAAVASIMEFGVAGAPIDRIAKRANATGGAVQHHFGSRDGLLLSVVEDVGERLQAATQQTRLQGAGGVEERVEAVCNASWSILSSPNYLVVIQILLATQENEPLYSKIFARLSEFENTLDQLWVRLFEGSGIDPRQVTVTRHIAMAAYRGLALRMLYRGDRTRWASELRMLKEMIIDALQGHAAEPPPADDAAPRGSSPLH
jgi:AcrR family transcriptional regulator